MLYGGSPPISRQSPALKLLLPASVVTQLVGNADCDTRRLQAQLQLDIKVSPLKGSFYPGAEGQTVRQMVLQSENSQKIHQAVARIFEVARQPMYIDSAEPLRHPRGMRIWIILPSQAVNAIMGRGGQAEELYKSLCTNFQAVMKALDHVGTRAEQVLEIIGSRDSRYGAEGVVHEIVKMAGSLFTVTEAYASVTMVSIDASVAASRACTGLDKGAKPAGPMPLLLAEGSGDPVLDMWLNAVRLRPATLTVETEIAVGIAEPLLRKLEAAGALQDLEARSGARISVHPPEAPDDPTRALAIVGPLVGVQAVHFILESLIQTHGESG
mmetsp:Transcript_124356/g.284968  ORF Transcript_124356/g.284968 Transcript_124356/m.284968 type:complete len:326 (+) Transcript_124356:17-994(+)